MERNRLAASLLLKYAETSFSKDSSKASQQRWLMIQDAYIKDYSYALINKIFFLLAVILGIAVLAWPVVALLGQGTFWEKAVVQTSVTALAAGSFAVYSHYKKRQVFLDNLLRYLVFTDDTTEQMLVRMMEEMSRLDLGFSFSEAVLKKEKEKEKSLGAGA